jgi:P-type E1-E2 ATPase
MIQIDIPGFGVVQCLHAVFDYNGTLAFEGKIDNETIGLLQRLMEKTEIHVLTADTYGLVEKTLKDYSFSIHILDQYAEAEQKATYVKELDESKVVAFGNGNNDVEMLRNCRVGIAVIGEEGCSRRALEAADLVVKDIKDGIELLLQPLRLKAGLRY